jgi:RNA polymerase sigma-70 factor (ECF subfamily)
MPEADDYTLIRQSIEGNMVAFEELVYRYDKQVLSIATNFMGNREDAKDIYQEVFLRVYRALPHFEFRSSFPTWLHKIVTNVCLTQRSRRRRHLHASLDEVLPGQEESQRTLADTIADRSSSDQKAIGSQISDHVAEAMDSLSPKQKMVFTLRHYQGYKLKEIAGMMNCAEGTIKKYLFTATERLRDRLKEVY